MKKNIIALRTTYKDGSSYLYGDIDFYVGNEESEKLALMLVANEAKGNLKYDTVDSISACYCNAEWNFEVTENSIYNEIPMTVNVCDLMLANEFVIPEPTGKVLEVIPDWCMDNSLKKKLNKIRKAGKCTDWTKLDGSIEFDNNSWWYLHGKLESKVHYDKATILANKAGDSIDTVRWYSISGDKCDSYSDKPHKQMYVNGIRRCNVVGIHGDCLGFFWTADERTIYYDKGTFSKWEQRGLVVQRNDRMSVLYAYHKYLMKHECL